MSNRKEVMVGTRRYWEVLGVTGRYWEVLAGTGRYWQVRRIRNDYFTYFAIMSLRRLNAT